MKISAAQVFVCSPGRNFVTLKISTDEGLTGLGDATLNGRELAVASYLTDHVIPCLIGRDAHQIVDIWQYLYRGAYWRRGPVTMSAIAAVDTALWDISTRQFRISASRSTCATRRKPTRCFRMRTRSRMVSCTQAKRSATACRSTKTWHRSIRTSVHTCR
jgi:hypothetical protein